MEYYSAIKKNEILPFAIMWMELQCFMLSDKSVRERQISYDFTHMRTLRYKIDELKGNKNNTKTERGTKCKRLLSIENRGLLQGLWEGG